VDRAGVHHPEQADAIVGAVLQPERLDAANAAAVASVIDGDDPVTGLGEALVTGDPVGIGAEHPAVEENHGPQRGVLVAGVTDEDLPATGQHHRTAGRVERLYFSHGHVVVTPSQVPLIPRV